jgi:multisubunit Na+/H+ antiporter MnhB subunit
MKDGSNPLAVAALAVGMFVIVFGPPVWWYSHGRRAGERRERRWGAIILGLIVLLSASYIRPSATAEWVAWAANLSRIVGGAWLIAWGAKGKRV